MSFVETYRSQVLQAIDAIDLKQVEQAIEWFREARAAGRMIFVAGDGVARRDPDGDSVFQRRRFQRGHRRDIEEFCAARGPQYGA